MTADRALRIDSDRRIRAATGPAATEVERQVYEMVLLDTLVHELNTVRGLLGEPTRLHYASLALGHVTVMLRFGDLPVAIHWIDLPGIARYGMEFALYAPDRLRDVAFCQAIIDSHHRSAPVDHPTAAEAGGTAG